uniref:Phosphatidylinositol transfer protein alpha isoform n=1 Tax=Gasterosteus aculeatus aculeatus TaxID=481459 RepID=G3NPK9_GASAC
MLIKEFRIVLPISVEEYQVGQLYAVAEASKSETGGGEGVEVIRNEPYEKDGETGQYTHKIYHLKSKVPDILAKLAPKGSLVVEEEAWNAYPYCKTVITNVYMKEKFTLTIETWHKPDMGEQENVHGLDKSQLDKRTIVDIDIADSSCINPKEYNKDHDPAIFKSQKTGRGPLGPNWKKELADNPDCPRMCAYKLVTVEFKWFAIQGTVENMIQKFERRLFTHFHRQLFCWIDRWYDLSMDDIRRMEEETKKELDEMRVNGDCKEHSKFPPYPETARRAKSRHGLPNKICSQ